MPPQATAEKVTILVVDDEPAIGDALKLVLEASGYEVVLVAQGQDGIKEAQGRLFSLGIVDLFLGDMSGLDVIKAIRKHQPAILTILMTANGTPRAFTEARNLGAVGVLAKPFPPAEILQLITSALAR